MIKLNETFYEEEVRCDHLVTKEVKALWAVELDLLDQFKRICDKYGLKYYAAGGTLLGAARHQGFIPWDDDIDLHMMAEDYEKFCEVAPQELEYPYFFQSWQTEEQAPVTHARIRRSDTTGCTAFEYRYCTGDYNRGIFVDIFPLYNVPDSKLKHLLHRFAVTAVRGVLAGEERLRRKEKEGVTSVKRYLDPFVIAWKLCSIFTDGRKLRRTYLKVCGWEKKKTRRVGDTSFNCNSARLIWQRDIFEDTVELPFENTTVACPKGYEEFLTGQYRDWRTPIKNLSYHEMEVFDPYTPFAEKLQ